MSTNTGQQQHSTKQELKFRKCQNLGCDVMIAFRRKTDGSGGWSAVEKDNLGQIVVHRCMGKRPSSTMPQQQKQPQPPQEQQPQRQAGASPQSQENNITEAIILLRRALELLEGHK